MSETSVEVDPAIVHYYELAPEEHRLERGPSLLEALRTRELIGRFVPRPPATVLDVGGAAGAYALWMACDGYTVHLVDPVERLVKEAQRRSEISSRGLASCQIGDARELSFPNQCADIILMLGPLYHLIDVHDRALALAEAVRVLRPGGYLFAAAISRWASLLDGLTSDLFADPQFARIAEQDLRDGQHRNSSGRLDYFTTAYFHKPDDLRTEVASAGVELIGVFGVEGPGWILPDVSQRLADPRQRQDLLRVARQVESEPAILAMSAHLLAVARKSPKWAV